MILSRNHNGKRMNHGCVIFLCENSKKLCRISEISNPGNSVRRTSVAAPERYPAPELSLPCHDVVSLPNLNEQIVARNRGWPAREAHFFKEGVDWKCWFSMIFHDFFVIMHDLHNMGSCRKPVSLSEKWPRRTTAVVAHFFAREKEPSIA